MSYGLLVFLIWVGSHNIRKWKLLFLKKRFTTSDFDVFFLLLQCVDGCEMREIFSGFEQVLIRHDSLNSWKFSMVLSGWCGEEADTWITWVLEYKSEYMFTVSCSNHVAPKFRPHLVTEIVETRQSELFSLSF